VRDYLRDLWLSGKPFVSGFGKRIWILIPSVFFLPSELYEYIIRPNFGDDTWREHFIVPAILFPWALLVTVLCTAFLAYRELHREHLALNESLNAATLARTPTVPAPILPRPDISIRQVLKEIGSYRASALSQAAFDGNIIVWGRINVNNLRNTVIFFSDIEEPIDREYWRHHEIDTDAVDNYADAQTKLSIAGKYDESRPAAQRDLPTNLYKDLRLNRQQIKEAVGR